MKRAPKPPADDRPFYAGKERYARWDDMPERYRVRRAQAPEKPVGPWAAFG